MLLQLEQPLFYLTQFRMPFPDGLGNSSGQVGHNLMDHHYRVGATGNYDGFKDQYTSGRRANGIYIPRFRNLDDKSKRKDYVRGFGYQGSASRGRFEGSEKIGIELKQRGSQLGRVGYVVRASWGEQLTGL
jgi:hypothetical protein